MQGQELKKGRKEKKRAAPRPRKKVKMVVGEELFPRLLLLGHGCGSKAVKRKTVKQQRAVSAL